MRRTLVSLLAPVALWGCAGADPQPPPPPSFSPVGPHGRAPGAPTGPERLSAGQLAPVQPSGEPSSGQGCSRDDDCGLVPVFGCCGNCPPTPPYRALTHGAIEAERQDDEAQCATEDHDCSVHRCTTPPPGCTARAVCRQGVCAVEQSDSCQLQG